MESITLNDDLCSDALIIPGAVADRMINEANEAQLKIYLYLQKFGRSGDVTVSMVADYFNYTESDVKRALKFWNRSGTGVKKERGAGTISEKQSEEAKVLGDPQGGNVVAFSVRPSYTKEKIAQLAQIPEVSQLLFVAEQYMARPLKSDDISSLLYMYDAMEFSGELVEYLLEYCISNNRKNFRSIEAMAVEWKEAGVSSVAEAKARTRQVPKEMKEVLVAFGMDVNHQPVDAEIAYVRKWTESFGYGMDIISQACQRTVLAIGKPNFKYANSIIKGWHDEGVKGLGDIAAADEKFRQKKVTDTAKGKAGSTKPAGKSGSTGGKGKFSNFNERDYDYASLMKDILSN